MRILKLILKGYKRFRLSSSDYFEYTPESKTQIILGTNGSGKSSLLQQLLPIVPDSSDFNKPGYKIIELNHRGSFYRLRSDFDKGQTHSLEKDGLELNPGGTAPVQKEMIYQEFGLTGEIVALLTDFLKFSRMPVNKRREWFIRMSEVDFDYALSVFHKLKERHRDVSGAVKLMAKRLVIEKEKTLHPETMATLESEVSAIHKELHVLIQAKTKVPHSSQQLGQEYMQRLEELRKISLSALNASYLAKLPDVRYLERNDFGELVPRKFHSIDEVRERIVQLRQDLAAKREIVSHLTNEHADLDKQFKALEILEHNDQQAINTKRLNLIAKKESLLGKCVFDIEFGHATQSLAALQTVKDPIIEIVNHLPLNDAQQYTTSRDAETVQKIGDYKQRILSAQQDLSVLGERIKHMKKHEHEQDTVCPNCNHRWNLVFDPVKLQQMEEQIGQREASLFNVTRGLESAEFEHEQFLNYRNQYQHYVRLTKSCSILQRFWDQIAEQNLILKAPKKITVMLVQLEEELRNWIEIEKVNTELATLESQIVATEKLSFESTGAVRTKMLEIQLAMENHTSAIHTLLQQIDYYSLAATSMVEAKKTEERLAVALAELERLNLAQIEALRVETIDDTIRQLQSSLARKEDVLYQLQNSANIVADIESQLATLQQQEQVAKDLVTIMSPTSGLIASGMFGFIHAFTSGMNRFIEKVWSYPMVLEDCRPTGDDVIDLDYKFPFYVKSVGNTIPDVSLGSSGMQEVFDLAYKIMAMKSLHMEDFPLFLDEFASKMDATHQVAAIGTIKMLMENFAFEQVFIVSHNYGQYASIGAAQYCIPDSANITLPPRYNENVKFTEVETA